MPKPTTRPLSHYAKNALKLFAQSIRERRIVGRITTTDLAVRAGISRALLQRIERGDPGASIGAYFEVAAIVGVTLFAEGRHELTGELKQIQANLVLLPKAIRAPRKAVKDDF
jgi:transcriptional regulator with XRE-family HTH domain